MAFTKEEKQELLKVSFVGEKVISRFEEVGYDSFEKLRSIDSSSLCELIGEYLNSSCYKNSPQARKAISGAIECAKNNV